ncbi:MAG: tRNA (adenosine(37)-N6)-dimethylallyltransferase MiaA [Candidatus Azambacteria bacterium]|nr:tRNA (adenosine(37)-N6)-dimethylallyltransferase MiaA [Candidatus Azambacteria bacterium]
MKKSKKKLRVKYNPKIIVVVGPTASGKSTLAVKLAKKFKGEIISADSRQVYEGMDIGTGKITPDTKNSSNFSTGQAKKKYVFTHKGIPHYCIDVANPKNQFSVAQYKQLAEKVIKKIIRHGKIPIICGGTGFYIQAITENISIPEIKPDIKLRTALEKKSTKELFSQLKKLDSRRAKNIDKNNRRRLIRALEIIIKSGNKVPELKSAPKYEVLFIGVKRGMRELKELIKSRLLKRLKIGMVKEIINLKKLGLSWQRLEDFGLEYRYVAYYLQNKLSYDEMVSKLQKEIEHYAKRQMTWFNRNKKIRWVANSNQAGKLVKGFLP